MDKLRNILMARARDAEKSSVQKPGEGSKSCDVLQSDQSPRSPSGKECTFSKHVSSKVQSYQETKRHGLGESNEEFKDWPKLSEMEMSSNPSTKSALSITNTSPWPVPNSGYISRHRGHASTAEGEVGGRRGHLPKFGEWDNQDDAYDPCFTLLFQIVSDEKKGGVPILVPVPQPSTSAREGDLYSYHSGLAKSKRKSLFCLLCCFAVR
uniref:RIN4 pathogenic type III effector avirulence factor Avr cleavage site domain-containing protein n=1 Tax=Physcomitrium patens TaxID=3218 RepID=A0A2K1L3M3_PHYPA|nr:hypothetical protein PHYPA_003420 [Physcomitrium patens]